MRSFSDMWYDPPTRKKILIFGGAGLAFLIILIIIIVVTTSGSKTEHFNGAMVLDEVPLVDGRNGLANNLFHHEKNQLASFNFTDLTKNDTWTNPTNPYKSNTDLSRLITGKVRGQFWAASVDCNETSPVRRTLEQIDVIKRLIDLYDDMELVTDHNGIRNAFNHNKIGGLIGIEGGHSIDLSLAVLRLYYEGGVRYMTLTSECNTRWAQCYNDVIVAPAPPVTGLTPFGKTVIAEMNRLGMIVDIAHGSKETMSDAIEASKVPVIISHSASANITDFLTNVDDSILLKLRDKEGIIMVNFGANSVRTDTNTSVKVTVDDVIMHLDHIKKITGKSDFIGIGSDYDGVLDPAEGLEDVSKYAALFNRLTDTFGNHEPWNRNDLQNLAGENLLRVMAAVEKYRDDNKLLPINEDILDITAAV